MPTGNQAFVKQLRDRIDQYFKIVLRNVRDLIPKTIGYFLVQKSQDKLQNDLWMKISANQRIMNLLGEPPSVTERRKQLRATCDSLNKSLKVLQRDPDITNAAAEDDELAQDLARELEADKANKRG